MSTSKEFVEFVCDCVRETGDVRSKKMFGEYMVYVNEKPVLLLCDNTVFVKKLPELESLMANAPVGRPYDAAREHYILDIENLALSKQVIAVLEPITPYPKKRKPKKGMEK